MNNSNAAFTSASLWRLRAFSTHRQLFFGGMQQREEGRRGEPGRTLTLEGSVYINAYACELTVGNFHFQKYTMSAEGFVFPACTLAAVAEALSEDPFYMAVRGHHCSDPLQPMSCLTLTHAICR